MTKNKLLSALEEPNPTYGVLQRRYSASIDCSCGYHGKIGGIEKENQLRRILREIRREHHGLEHRYSIKTSCHASELTHASASQTTRQTLSGASSNVYTDVSGATISSANFTTGKKYLLIVSARFDSGDTNSTAYLKMLHGSTDFAGSECGYDPQGGTGTSNEFTYLWWTVWRAVSGEGIKMQFKNQTSNITTGADNISLTAIKLSDDLTEDVDWKYAENATDSAITTGLDGASITFTPIASSDWLVMTLSQHEIDSTSVEYGSKIIRSGETSSSDPFCQQEGEDDTNDFHLKSLVRVFSCTATSNTFKEQTYHNTGGTSGTRLHSQVFALNLNKLRNRTSSFTAGPTNITSTSGYGQQLATTSITPAVAGDVLVMGFMACDAGDVNRKCNFRIQVDNTDIISGWSTDSYPGMQAWDPLDENEHSQVAIVNMTAASHNIDMDVHVDSTTGTPAAKSYNIVAFSMELRSGVVNISPDGTGDYTTLSSALNAEGANTKYVLAPGLYSEYNIDASYNNIVIEGSGIDNTILEIPSAQTGDVQLLKFLGTEDTAYNLYTTDPIPKGATQIRLETAGQETNFAVGDDIFISDNQNVDSQDADGYRGEWHVVTNVNTGNNKLTLETPLRSDYDTTKVPTVRKWNMRKNIILRDLTLRSAASTSGATKGQVQFKFCKNVIVENCHFDSLHHSQLHLRAVVNGKVSKCSILKTRASGTPRYGLNIVGATTHLFVTDCFFYDARHAITIGPGSDISGDRGNPNYIYIRNCTAHMASTAHYDLHHGCGYIRFDDCVAIGSDTALTDFPAGFSLRSPVECHNCHVSFAYYGFYLHEKSTANSTTSPGASGSKILNCSVSNIVKDATQSNSGSAVYAPNDCQEVLISGLFAEYIASAVVNMQSGTPSSDRWTMRGIWSKNTSTDSGGQEATITVNGDNHTIENCFLTYNQHTSPSGIPVKVSSGSNNNIIRNCYFENNTSNSPSILSVADTGNVVESNFGYNPTVKVTNPISASTIGSYGGTTATPTANTAYTVLGSDITLSSSGGTGVSITIKDSAGTTIASGLTSLTLQFLRRGWTINFGGFSVAPTVTVLGH